MCFQNLCLRCLISMLFHIFVKPMRIFGMMILAALMLYTGCTAGNLATDQRQESEEGTMLSAIELTQEETELLCAAFSGEERIRKGDLLSYEIELVQQLRFGREYLSRKYPSQIFRMQNCIPQNKENAYTTVDIQAENDRKQYELRLTTSEDKTISAADNFYETVVKKDYEAHIADAARGATKAFLAAQVNVPYLYGEEYDAELTLDAVLEQEIELSVEAAVFLDGTEVGNIASMTKELEEALKGAGCHGSFWIYYLKERPENWTTAEDLQDFVNAGRYQVIYAREKISL